jgi:hypothetical protein
MEILQKVKNNMNLIICIHGILGGKKGKNGKGGLYSPKELYNHLADKVISPNKSLYDKIYIVIHSWSKDEEKHILKSFNPNVHVIERNENRRGSKRPNSKRHVSKLDSLFKSINLCSKLDINNNDIIFHTRFDNYYKKPLIINPEHIEQNKTIYFPGDNPDWKDIDKETRVCDNYFIGNAKHLINHLTDDIFNMYINWINEGKKGNPKIRGYGKGRIDNHTILMNIFKDTWTIVKSKEYISKKDILIHREEAIRRKKNKK